MPDAMPVEIARELQRLRDLYESIEKPFRVNPGASDELLDVTERETGIRFDHDLRALWRFSNGTRDTWFAAMTDELTGCGFPSLERAREAWSWFSDSDSLDEWKDPRSWDKRIRSGYLHRRLWFPIAEFNGFSTALYFDADPSPEGRYGQIIAYQHDPDAVYYVADCFRDFFRRSNELLADNITEIFFLADEFERICHMNGLGELRRQLAAGLNVNRPNWNRLTLRDMAKKNDRRDIIEFLDRR